jgi:hypothetical protein
VACVPQELKELLEGVASSCNGAGAVRIKLAPLKGRSRALEKARDDYSHRLPGPAFSYLYDVVRASVVCGSEDAVLAVVDALRTGPRGAEVLRIKNRWGVGGGVGGNVT